MALSYLLSKRQGLPIIISFLICLCFVGLSLPSLSQEVDNPTTTEGQKKESENNQEEEKKDSEEDKKEETKKEDGDSDDEDLASDEYDYIDPAASDSEKKRMRMERIKVTGSRIKKIDANGAQPILTLDRNFLDRSGYQNVSDVLRELTVASFGARRERTGTVDSGRGGAPSLRGLPTLVLVNGSRLPAVDGSGTYDINLIPMNAVEKIDILKDGASAIYGSDALGGVINIILKNGYEGVGIAFQGQATELKGGENHNVSMVYGSNSSRSRSMTVVQYREKEVIKSKDRDFSALSPDQFSTLGNPGSYKGQSGEWTPDPNCPADQITPFGGGSICSFDYSQFSEEAPMVQQLDIYSESEYKVTEDFSLFAKVLVNRQITKYEYAPAPGVFTTATGTNTINLGEPTTIRYRFVENGNRVTNIEANSHGVTGGAKGYFLDTWDWELQTAHSRYKRVATTTSGALIRSKVTELVEDGDYDPFAAGAAKGDLSAAQHKPWQSSTTVQSTVDFIASGELTDMASGPLSLAVGADFLNQTYKEDADPFTENGDVIGGAGSVGKGSRAVYAIFSEFDIPLSKRWDLQIAGRYDEYSDFGSTINPKVGTTVRMGNWGLFRASAGTGFLAPSLEDLYGGTSFGFPAFIDRVACDTEITNGVTGTPSCSPGQWPVTSGGNPELQEEKSQIFTAGFVVQPSKSFSFSIDGFYITTDQVVGADLEKITQAELQGEDLSQYGIIVNRDDDNYLDAENGGLIAPNLNLSERIVSGVDFSTTFRMNGSVPKFWKLWRIWDPGKLKGRWTIKNDFSYIIDYKEEDFPGFGYEQKAGTYGFPNWRDTLTLAFSTDRAALSISGRAIAGTEKYEAKDGKLPMHVEWDLNYDYRAFWKGRFNFGIKNVFGQPPTIDRAAPPTNPINASLYDPVGRLAYFGYSQDF